MPLTAKGEKILKNMEEEYGKERAERVLYASKNKGTIAGIDTIMDCIERYDAKRLSSFPRKDRKS